MAASKLSAKDRRAITQTTGARVFHRGDEDMLGIVVGHYDDDVVYVQFDKDPVGYTTSCYTESLTLVKEEK